MGARSPWCLENFVVVPSIFESAVLFLLFENSRLIVIVLQSCLSQAAVSLSFK
jgi:hypothetical protein